MSAQPCVARSATANVAIRTELFVFSFDSIVIVVRLYKLYFGKELYPIARFLSSAFGGKCVFFKSPCFVYRFPVRFIS